MFVPFVIILLLLDFFFQRGLGFKEYQVKSVMGKTKAQICVRLQFWCIHRRFPTAAEFSQKDDDGFRLYMVKRILQYYGRGSSSMLYLLNKRKIMVHDLTEEERNIIDLSTDDIDNYLK
jgi:hypothetical protein